MFFVFEVEVLEVPGGFRAWFQQSFCTFESFLMLLVAWISWCVSQDLYQGVLVCVCVLKCLRKASIYRSLGVGERHVAKFDWWHVSQSDWRGFKTFSPTHVTSFDWPKCFDFQGDTCQHPIGLPVSMLTRARLLMSSLTPADVWLVFTCILCPYFNDTWQISIGFWVVIVKPSSSTWRFVIGCILWTW